MNNNVRTFAQGVCDVSNTMRLGTRKGAQTVKEAEIMASAMMDLIYEQEPGINALVVAQVALAMVRRYVRCGTLWAVGTDCREYMNKLEELFEGDAWMQPRHDLRLINMMRFANYTNVK
jgi:hypothetical protein